jgi:hypothetical protein
LQRLRRLLEPEEGAAVPDVPEPPAAPAKS